MTPAGNIVVIGASSDPSKYGYRAVSALKSRGYNVFPVNPRGGEILGLKAYRSVAELPEMHVDRISMYVPAEAGLEMLPQIVALGCDEFWLNPGSESPELIAAAEAQGLNIVQACTIMEMD